MIDKADIVRALHLTSFGAEHLNSVWPDSQFDLLEPIKNKGAGANSIYLVGVMGAGKSSLLACFCVALFREFTAVSNVQDSYLMPDLFATRAAYITHSELVDFWVAPIQGRESGLDQDYYKTIPILFLDDMAAITASDFNIGKTEDLIDYRWRNHLKTFIASNISIADFKKPKNAQWHRIARRLEEPEWMIQRILKTKYGGKK